MIRIQCLIHPDCSKSGPAFGCSVFLIDHFRTSISYIPDVSPVYFPSCFYRCEFHPSLYTKISVFSKLLHPSSSKFMPCCAKGISCFYRHSSCTLDDRNIRRVHRWAMGTHPAQGIGDTPPKTNEQLALAKWWLEDDRLSFWTWSLLEGIYYVNVWGGTCCRNIPSDCGTEKNMISRMESWSICERILNAVEKKVLSTCWSVQSSDVGFMCGYVHEACRFKHWWCA